MALQLIHQPDGIFRLGDFLIKAFEDHAWTEFRAAVAFVKYSGTKHIAKLLNEFSKRGMIRISVGIDAGGTSIEGLSDLLNAIEDRGRIWVFHNANYSTFHPKIYLFRNEQKAEVVIGSGNLTEGGLFTNYEASIPDYS